MELQARRAEPRPSRSRRLSRRCVHLLVVAALGVAAIAALPQVASAASSQAVESEPTLTKPASPTRPPAEHFLTAREVERIARLSPKLREELRRHRRVRVEPYAKGPGRWQVSYFAGGEEVAQVIVDERRGRAVEVWTGPQVKWQMARGLPGAFGRRFNSPAVWALLIIAFLVPFVDVRRPLRLLHLDLVVLLGFGVSHIYFNRGEIFTSVPLVYPVLIYLLVRMLMLARSRAGPGLPHVSMPLAWLGLGLVFLVGFRVGLNLTNSNVIDVGYSGVIGADHITHGRDVYGAFPQDNPSGDTYGPVSYLAYVPWELAWPWGGTWDDLPAAHGAAVFFDLATIAALFVLGRRLLPGADGNRLGLVLAYGWAAYPYTLFVLSSNANDSLVALLVVLAFVALASPVGRGALLALASAAKFAPLALAPLFAGFERFRLRDAAIFTATFAVVTAVVFVPLLPDGGVSELWDRTLGFQLDRDSPFSIWGQEDWLDPLHVAVTAGAALLALAVAFVPREKSVTRRARARRGGSTGGAARDVALVLPLHRLVVPARFHCSARAGTRSCSIDAARLPPSVVTRHAITQGSSSAVSKRTGSWVRNRSRICSRLTPITPPRAPVIPTSEMYAVPWGSTRRSAVGTWVCVPSTASTRPSRCQPIATFSLVASAWKSTRIRSASFSSRSSRPSITRNGERAAFRKTVPLRFTIPQRTPSFSTTV